ncbi:enoyl-CoA hydratase/isomerase family protein [Brevibacillus centrosporus]|uniref:enoyl-CoA hydratase/isomerase family protein n=1 Tax=Brevibacillus centrosporus TaxID=54910 RepID=UPI003817C84E
MRVMIKRVTDGKITLQETSKMAIITMNRPASRNALTSDMWLELARLVKSVESNPKNKVVILKGARGQFSAGSDIREFTQMTADEANAAFEKMEDAMAAIENISLPVIGVIDGPAMGAGFILSLACDIRIGTRNTKMGIPVGRLGITLGPSFVQRIVRLIGPSRTKELVYTGKIYDYHEAKQLGLVNVFVENREELEHTCLKTAGIMADQSMASLAAVKKAVHLCEQQTHAPWKYVDPVDFHEGCLSFVEKRKPHFG